MQKNNKPQIDLAELVAAIIKPQDSIDPSKYRYVIYARKSTDEKTHQARSLGDQVAACQEFAKEKNLTVVGEPIQEAMSAKTPDIRPKFTQMLKDIKAGKFDGIISWHPDRLARNMREGGEIIDLIDREIIKDLKFCSFTFEKSTNGVMLLGFTFAMSKQYSDKLGEDISRGTNRSIREGKYLHVPKKGYFKDRNNFLRPDGKNFSLLSLAWQMRLAGKELTEIADFLNNRGFEKAVGPGGDTHEPILMNMRRMSEIFRDPIYAGVMKYGENVVPLADVYDFEPMVSESDFLRLNKLGDTKSLFVGRERVKKSVSPSLLSRQVICSSCGKPTMICITSKHTKSPEKGIVRYFYYRCDTPKCLRKGKATRAKIVVEFATSLIESWDITDERLYKHFVSESAKDLAKSQLQVLEDKKQFQLALKTSKQRIAKLKTSLTSLTDQAVIRSYELDISAEIAKHNAIEAELEKLATHLQQVNDSVPSYDKFLELFRKVPDRLRFSQSETELNSILSKIFLNFTVDGEKVLAYQLNEPFAGLVKRGLIRDVDNTRFELVTSRM